MSIAYLAVNSTNGRPRPRVGVEVLWIFDRNADSAAQKALTAEITGQIHACAVAVGRILSTTWSLMATDFGNSPVEAINYWSAVNFTNTLPLQQLKRLAERKLRKLVE